MDDAGLLQATARGDADAFAAFYRRHVERVLGFLLRASGDPEVAADLAGEVFATALAGCARYRAQQDTALPWLIGIAHNKLRESRRRGRVQNAVRQRLQIAALPIGDADVAHVLALDVSGDRDVLAAIEQLPPHERAAIHARIVEDRDYREIAASLQCSESVIRQRVSRGLARARARLTEDGPDDGGQEERR